KHDGEMANEPSGARSSGMERRERPPVESADRGAQQGGRRIRVRACGTHAGATVLADDGPRATDDAGGAPMSAYPALAMIVLDDDAAAGAGGFPQPVSYCVAFRR